MDEEETEEEKKEKGNEENKPPQAWTALTFQEGPSFQLCKECREGFLCVLPVAHALQQSSGAEKCNHWLSLER